MRIALFADIHANQPAFAACLAHARGDGAEQHILLGDYVGYGADPEWCVSAVMDLVAGGAVALQGNHDCAVNDPRVQMNVEATAAMEWTRGELGQKQRQFLADLPLSYEDPQGRLYVHADASRPASWNYVVDAGAAAHSMQATTVPVTFCGHVHRPALYSMSTTGKLTSFTPVTDVPIQLLQGRQWLAVLGSVGQPRDGNPAASYAMLDTVRRELSYRRVPYDVGVAAERIRAQGLPSWLADRLLVGR
jgi:diadenosine tetraphosphatase ApaH/serine/threonine PP2A family protein phosphatase